MPGRLPTFRRLAHWVLATIVVLAVGGFVIATSGLYNIAASEPHWPIVRWFLEYAMRRSVDTHSMFVERPETLDGIDLVRLGAGHFHGNCAVCHGAPGTTASPVFDQMRPKPPDLAHAALDWSDVQLFWIVKHGLKYTGMPAWTARQRDDEVWPVVAFLRQLPALDAGAYRALIFGGVSQPPAAEHALSDRESPTALAACSRCHGDRLRPTASRLIPELAGQSQQYLEMSLRAYAAEARQSGIMLPIASELDEVEIRELSAQYSALTPRRVRSDSAARFPERGRRIAVHGLPESEVPPCLSCHGEARLSRYPSLAGQHAAYMANQLRLWQQGLRDETPGGALMSTIAKRLTEQQIEDVSLFFEKLSVDERKAGR